MQTVIKPDTTTKAALPATFDEDLSGGIADTGNRSGTHDCRPSFSDVDVSKTTYYITCTKQGLLGFGNYVPSDCTELASTTKPAIADQLLSIIERTANLVPGNGRYVPMATEVTNQDDRNYFTALYAAKLHRETRSCPV